MTAQTSAAFILPGQPLPPASSSSTSSSASASSSSPSAVPSSTGVYTRSSYTLSSLTGKVQYSEQQQQPSSSSSSSSSKPTKKQRSKSTNTTTASISTPLSSHLRLPEPDSIVLARITRITSRQALCSILLVGNQQQQQTVDAEDDHCALSISQALASGVSNHAAGEDPAGLDFSGVIRQQDVRLTEIDKVKMVDCFRVGDLVRAKVVSLGDSRSYYLTTASNELGVIFATASHPPDVLPSSHSNAFLPASLQSPPTTTSQDSSDIPGALRPLNWQEMIHPLTGAIEKRKVAKPLDV